jgi:hypothetical protein
VPTLKRFARAAIRMYAGDHGEPHFHVETPEDRCAVSIRTLTVLAGRVPQRVLREALAWAATHRQFLLAKWKELNR